TREPGLKRSLQRLSSAVGEETRVISELSELGGGEPPALIFYDLRGASRLDAVPSAIPSAAQVLFLTSDQALMESLGLMVDPRVVSVVAFDERFDSNGFLVATAKSLRGDLYGVEKYFSWGVHTESTTVQTYEEKSAAIERLKEFARLAGCRGPVRER